MRTRQVLSNVWPGVKLVPGDTVTSATNDALSVHAIGGGATVGWVASVGGGAKVGAGAALGKMETETAAGSLATPAELYARTEIVWVPWVAFQFCTTVNEV